MLKGIATISLFAADHEAATQWYTQLLGIEPYFNRPGYTEFRVGDYQQEVGIIDRQYVPNMSTQTGGIIVYWQVDNIEQTLQTLKDMGAKEYEPLTHRGGGFTTASVIDPFGNILGIMDNPHYKEVLIK